MKAIAFSGCAECRHKWPCEYSVMEKIAGGSRFVPDKDCPYPDIPIPHGTERMQAIQWKKAWDFIKALAELNISVDKGDVPIFNEEGHSNEEKKP